MSLNFLFVKILMVYKFIERIMKKKKKGNATAIYLIGNKLSLIWSIFPKRLKRKLVRQSLNHFCGLKLFVEGSV